MWWEAKLTPRVRTEWGYMSKAMTDSGGEMIATIKSAVYFKGKERRGVDPGSRVFACGVWVSFWLQGLRWGSSFYTLSFLIDAATLGVCANRLRCSWGSDC
jgi:hypothetical protein